MDATQMSADTLNTRGNQAYLASDLARAEALYIAALDADPLSADAWGNLGLIWATIGERDDALKCYNRALALNPALVETICNLGMLTEECGYRDNAIRLYRRALELKPGFARASANLAVAHLKNLDFAAGWPLLEGRFTTVPPVSMMRDYPVPLYRGQAIPKRLYVWPEQGVGDQIIYGTVLHDLIRDGHEFVYEVDARLVRAFKRAMPEGEFVPKDHRTGLRELGCDYHVPVMSLAAQLRPTVTDFYLGQGQPAMLHDQGRIEGINLLLPQKRRVAISWRSFQPDINRLVRDRKSAPLSAFAALAARDDLALVDVQYGDTAAERRSAGIPLARLPHDLTGDIDAVLAMIACCNCVVTTSNVTAHFAGAMGVKTYLIAKDEPVLFYWHSKDGKCLWYPSVEVVCGPTWEDAIAKATTLL
jgi:tetratricopeptide (TPR) repeat protein